MSFALDAVDTMSQVVSGDMSLGDGLKGLVKNAAGVAVGSVASWAGSVAGDTVKSVGLGAIGSVAASVSSAVVQNYVNCYANSAIQALDFNHGFKFDKDKFKEGTKNIHNSALSAALTATASSTVMAAFGADWNNGKMGFTDATGRDLSFMGEYGKTAQNLAGMASGLSGQIVSAAMGNGFSMNILSSDDLGLGGNRTGLLSLTLGGDNSGFKFGSSAGWDISMSAIGNFVGSMDYLTTKMKDDKVAQFFLANNDSKEGMARLTYVNYGNLSGNTVATNIAQQIIRGDKKLEFGISASDAGHYGHADVKNDTIQLNERALEISRDNLGAVGGFTAMMAREGFLIDANKALGTAEWSDEKMRETGAGAILTMAAFNVQKGAMDDIAKNLNIKYEGEWAGIKDKVDYVARTGDLSGFDATGRDLLIPQLLKEKLYREKSDQLNTVRPIRYPNGQVMLPMSGDILKSQMKALLELSNPGGMFRQVIGGVDKIQYINQQLTSPYGDYNCQVSCGAMAMGIAGIDVSAESFREKAIELYRDKMNGQPEQWNPAQVMEYAIVTANTLLRENGKNDSYEVNRGWNYDMNKSVDQLREQIDRGSAVVAYSPAPSPFGHVVTVVGYDAKGFYVYDPAGDYERNGGFFKGGGKMAHYSYDFVKRMGIGSAWYSIGKK